MGRWRKPKNSWRATTSSSVATWTKPSIGRSASRRRARVQAAASRFARSRTYARARRAERAPPLRSMDTRLLADRVFREERARILAGLIRVSGSFDSAEDALQDSFAAAVVA